MAHLSRLLFLFAFFQTISGVLAIPSPGQKAPNGPGKKKKCKTIHVRKEWRDLTVKQRLDYIRAVKCLQAKPTTIVREGASSRFDEFLASHADDMAWIHAVGQFLPWHRHFVTLYNNALRDECGYKGPAPYWDWSRDAESSKPLAQSPVFDAVTGFGGNGVPGTYTPPPNVPEFPGPDWPEDIPLPEFPTGLPGFPGGPTAQGGCIDTGPFKDRPITIGPANLNIPRCLTRAFYDDLLNNLDKTSVDWALAQKTYGDFDAAITFRSPPLEPGAGIHGAGHAVVGGLMTDAWASPGDPVFYLHHANLDRVWAKWQSADKKNRLYQIAGYTTQWPPYTNVTLDFEMEFKYLDEPLKVKEVMDIEAYPECYRYND
ncbi:hypothetical protein CC1G_08048 [Coprinopsis cinerea okayama7|uniref:Tyrosinase copper-binding domain-containing protein n=1 Tax=Coprinopsis cinerea (strain Okayama-7 / 130 / ATCC MYA-4618 / FGSC 9003) TaxID=240176 RepID=A8NQE7_COPC7|nr:hypothetical protein CC1G_08048 [Coprinopsis cinerea okayama7\|eukprot:XP_001835539.1 hypothetical protein CC1G_08048 [Coprinopsis cinerea okayama7\